MRRVATGHFGGASTIGHHRLSRLNQLVQGLAQLVGLVDLGFEAGDFSLQGLVGEIKESFVQTSNEKDSL